MQHGSDDRPLITAPPVAGIAYHWVALGLVCYGLFLGTMDTSIVNVALPTLASELDTSTENVLWVSLVYILFTTGLSLSMGRLGDLYGRKRIYVVGFAMFTVGMGMAAISGSLGELLGARIFQAVGASMSMASGAAIVVSTFPPSRRGQGLGIMAATVGAGVASGPVLGGVMVDLIDWRALFWTRIPAGVVGTLLVWWLLVDTPAERRPRGLDVPGSFLLFGLLSSAVLAVNRGVVWGWGSPAIVGLFLLSGALVVTFVWVERRTVSPVVDLALFGSRSFSGGVGAAVLQFMGLSAVVILMPFYLLDARGFSLLEAGGIMAALPLAMLVFSPSSGMLSDRFGVRVLTTLGLALVSVGLLLMATIDVETSVAGIVLRLIVIGIGTAIFQSPNTSSIMGSVGPDRLGTASAAATTARTSSNSNGISTAGAT